MRTMEYVVEMLRIRKEFPGIVACDELTLQLRKGEIHALLGENGGGGGGGKDVRLNQYAGGFWTGWRCSDGVPAAGQVAAAISVLFLLWVGFAFSESQVDSLFRGRIVGKQ